MQDRGKGVRPNDHVNCSQSSKDSFPTVMRVAAVRETRLVTLPGLKRLHAELEAKSKGFAKTIKIGRTHAQDATPLTLGRSSQVTHAGSRWLSSGWITQLEDILELAQDGTAAGTGLNTYMGFTEAIAEQAPYKFEPLATKNTLIGFHAPSTLSPSVA